jgi:predicted O-methyltransferase YrrM
MRIEFARRSAVGALVRMRRFLAALRESGGHATLVAIRAKRLGAKQKLREFACLCRLVEQRRPRVVVEIGTMRGGTLWAWCRLAAADALLVSIDLPGGAFGGGYGGHEMVRLKGYAETAQRLALIRADSHASSTLSELTQVLDGRLIDLLFIDGDHTYEGVRSDYETYAPLVAPGGLIVFHDILPCGREHGNVSKLWDELQSGVECREFVDKTDVSWRGQWGGIGVLFS